MQRRYSHLSRDERGKVMFLKMWGLKVSEIARRLGRNKGTIWGAEGGGQRGRYPNFGFGVGDAVHFLTAD